MPSTTRSHDPKTYILNFFYDDDDGSALTARINDRRFHIIVDPAKLRRTGGVANVVLQEYESHIDALRQAHEKSSHGSGKSEKKGRQTQHSPEEGVVRCICGATKDDEGLVMIACEECGTWQHNVCMSFTEDEEEMDAVKYYCELCKPSLHSQLLAAKKKRRKPWETRKKRALQRDAANPEEEFQEVEEDASSQFDSAVEVDGNEDSEQPARRVDKERNSSDSGLETSDCLELELDLQNWIMSCFGAEVQRIAPPRNESDSITVFDWYNTSTYYYELEIQDGALAPVEIEASKSLQRRVDELVPYMDMPKYLQKLDIATADPNNITVREASEAIEPVHPSVVEYKGEEFFFKAVNPAELGPTKREIHILHKIHDLGLHEKINVPQIHYLVSTAPGDKTSIMGFLETAISDPTPLTKLMDSDVDEKKRRKWAKESERIVQVLHENDIVWGDAKGDNFIVDKDDKLWIIDFGGSYTEGWVDPELNETEEGDDAGLEKVVGALHDPDGNTFDPEEDIAPEDHGEGKKKRRTCASWEDDWEEQATAKKARQ